MKYVLYNLKDIIKNNIKFIYRFLLYRRMAETIQIEPTTRCMFNCSICSRNSLRKERVNKDMDWETYEAILDYPYIKKMRFQGMGEPFFNIKLLDMLKSAKKRGIYTIITSTGFFPPESPPIEEFIPYLNELWLSIDSFSEEKEVKRNPIHTIKKLNSIKIPASFMWGINFVITFENLQELDYFENFFISYKPDLLCFAEVENWYLPSQGEIYKKSHEFAKKTKESSKLISKKLYDIRQKISAKKFYISDLKPRKNSCLWPVTGIFITYDGYVTPCCIRMDPDVINFGNIRKKPLIEILNGGKYNDYRKALLFRKPYSCCDFCPL